MTPISVTGLTAARMEAIEAASVVDGEIVDGNLILTRHDASTIDAGAVSGGSSIPPYEYPVVSDLNDISAPYDGQVVWWVDSDFTPGVLTGGAMVALVDSMQLLSPSPPPAGYVQWVPAAPNLLPWGRTLRGIDGAAFESGVSFEIPAVGLGQSWNLDYGFNGHEIGMAFNYSGPGGFFNGSGLDPQSVWCLNDGTDDVSCQATDALQVSAASGGGTLTVEFSGTGAAAYPWVRIACLSVLTYHPALDV